MFSKKKRQLGQTQIDFLSMHFDKGKYNPGPQITQELMKFLDENLTSNQVQ